MNAVELLASSMVEFWEKLQNMQETDKQIPSGE